MNSSLQHESKNYLCNKLFFAIIILFFAKFSPAFASDYTAEAILGFNNEIHVDIHQIQKNCPHVKINEDSQINVFVTSTSIGFPYDTYLYRIVDSFGEKYIILSPKKNSCIIMPSFIKIEFFSIDKCKGGDAYSFSEFNSEHNFLPKECENKAKYIRNIFVSSKFISEHGNYHALFSTLNSDFVGFSFDSDRSHFQGE